MSELYKNRHAKKQASKDYLSYLRRVVINWNFSFIYLLICLLVGTQFYICVLTTFTMDVFRIQLNIYDGVLLLKAFAKSC